MTARDFSTRPVRRSSLADLVLMTLAAALLVAAGAVTLTTQRDLAEARRSVEQARREPGAGRRGQAPDGRASSLQGLAAQALSTMEAPPPRVLADLGALMPAEVRLNGVTLIYGEGVSIDLAVVAREAASYDRFLERLAASPRFTDILPGAESREGAISAPIRMRYQGEAVP